MSCVALLNNVLNSLVQMDVTFYVDPTGRLCRVRDRAPCNDHERPFDGRNAILAPFAAVPTIDSSLIDQFGQVSHSRGRKTYGNAREMGSNVRYAMRVVAVATPHDDLSMPEMNSQHSYAPILAIVTMYSCIIYLLA